MTITTITSRELNQDVSKAKRAALSGPVFITDRGNTAHVLLSIEDYKNMTGKQQSMIELLAMPEAADVDLSIPKLAKNLYQPADFS